jgi:hypothetical protein
LFVWDGTVLILGTFSKKRQPNESSSKSLFIAGISFLMALAILVSFIDRATESNSRVPTASKNIYQQQVQMALFLRKHFPSTRVVLNDIGAIGYMSDVHIFDVMGLATNFPLQITSAEKSAFLAAAVERFGAEIAVTYEHAFPKPPGGASDTWHIVARWRIKGNYACASDNVVWRAGDKRTASLLLQKLKLFKKELPEDLIVTYADVQAESGHPKYHRCQRGTRSEAFTKSFIPKDDSFFCVRLLIC